MKAVSKSLITNTLKALAITVLCMPNAHSFQSENSAVETTIEQNTPTETVQSLKQKLQMLKTYTATFEQTVIDGQGEIIQQANGQLTLKQPNLMIWQVDEPDENLMVADGNTLWYADPFVEQVTAVDQSSSVANNPVVLLTDPDNQAWDNFNISHQDNGFKVVAKEPESQVAELFLQFSDNTLIALHFIDRQQQTSQLVFSEIRQNLPIGDEQFRFSIPDGFELDDQR